MCQALILQQLHDIGVHIFALQETRLRRVHTAKSPNYLLFHSHATEAGHFGIIIGFSTQHPHGSFSDEAGNSIEVFFQQNHFSVIAQDPRFVIVRVRTPIIQCIVIAPHAPHTGAEEREIEAWWRKVDDSIPQKYFSWDRILLVDANARVGSFPSPHVGTWQAENDSEKSDYFIQFLQTNSLWLPATFEVYQKGEGGTWRHNQGKWLRNDFVAIPMAWQYTSLNAHVSSEVDLSTVKEDHGLAVVEFTAAAMPIAKARTRKLQKRADQDLEWISQTDLQKLPSVQWDVDVHTHAHLLQQQLLQQIPKTKRPSHSNTPTKTSCVLWISKWKQLYGAMILQFHG